MKLRIAVAVSGAVLLLVGLGLMLVNLVFVQMAFSGAVILLATLFEARRYQARVSSSTGWQDTPEKFIDPTTGREMRVRYNPSTGERDYVEDTPT